METGEADASGKRRLRAGGITGIPRRIELLSDFYDRSLHTDFTDKCASRILRFLQALRSIERARRSSARGGLTAPPLVYS